MAAKLVVAPEAELDIAETDVWYERRRTGLGEELLSSVDASMEGIRRQPEMYPLVTLSIRGVLGICGIDCNSLLRVSHVSRS